MRAYHRRAPFLFFKGNTFADIARALAALLFRELPAVRLKELTSAVAHYVAGVLDREAMVEIVEGLSQSASFQAGDRVKTRRGSLRGVVTRVLEDKARRGAGGWWRERAFLSAGKLAAG